MKKKKRGHPRSERTGTLKAKKRQVWEKALNVSYDDNIGERRMFADCMVSVCFDPVFVAGNHASMTAGWNMIDMVRGIAMHARDYSGGFRRAFLGAYLLLRLKRKLPPEDFIDVQSHELAMLAGHLPKSKQLDFINSTITLMYGSD